MFKAGATYRDKNRIRKLHKQGMPGERISQLTQIRPEHVAAITAQVDAGSLSLNAAGKRNVNRRVGGGEYGNDDEDKG